MRNYCKYIERNPLIKGHVDEIIILSFLLGYEQETFIENISHKHIIWSLQLDQLDRNESFDLILTFMSGKLSLMLIRSIMKHHHVEEITPNQEGLTVMEKTFKKFKEWL